MNGVMMKTLAILLLGLSISTSFAAGKKRTAPTQAPTPVVSSVATPSPSAAPSGAPSPRRITLACDDSCTAQERAEVPQIEAKLNETLMSVCLTSYFMTPGRRFDYTNGLSPAQVLAKLRTGGALTLNYYYNRWTRAVGYESADDFSVIHFNRAKVSGWPICPKASLGAHEYSHTKEFYHMGNAAAPNYYSVPYQANHAYEGADGFTACCK